MYPNRWTTSREHFEVDRPHIYLVYADWRWNRYSGAGIAIYFSDFREIKFYRLWEIGGIPRTLKVKYLGNGL